MHADGAIAALIPRAEAAGPQGQAGSACFKFHYSQGEGIVQLPSLLKKKIFTHADGAIARKPN